MQSIKYWYSYQKKLRSDDFQIGGKMGTITYNAQQDLNSDYVNLTTTFYASSGWQNWNREMYLYRRMNDINIDKKASAGTRCPKANLETLSNNQ